MLLEQALLALELADTVLQLLRDLLALVDLLLVVGLARVHQRVLEQLQHLVQLLVHASNGVVKEGLKLL